MTILIVIATSIFSFINYYYNSQILQILQKKYPGLWIKMGKPSLIRQEFHPSVWLRLWKFAIFESRSKQYTKQLQTLCSRYRITWFLTMCLVVIGLLFLRLLPSSHQ